MVVIYFGLDAFIHFRRNSLFLHFQHSLSCFRCNFLYHSWVLLGFWSSLMIFIVLMILWTFRSWYLIFDLSPCYFFEIMQLARSIQYWTPPSLYHISLRFDAHWLVC